MPLRGSISASEFARRLRDLCKQPDKRFAFFLGAGCSVSSDIPDSRKLVRDIWLPRLREFRAPERKDIDVWAKEFFPEHDPRSPAALYGRVIEELFLSPEDRQCEIERLCEKKYPGFGYAVLAALMGHEGGAFNVAITTNFDDLLADALYLYTEARPLVILHESLAQYIRPTRTRPLIIKLHGDQRLSPMNTLQETCNLKENIESQVVNLLHDRDLIFIGYGGNDVGIQQMLERVPTEPYPMGVFWISGSEPTGSIRAWLDKRDANWVQNGDFDELFLILRDIFGVPHPDKAKFDEVFQRYQKSYEILSKRIYESGDAVPEAKELKKAVEHTDESFPDWLSFALKAKRLWKSNPEGAERLYKEGLEKHAREAGLLGDYALFLEQVRKNPNKAEEYYLWAIEADHNDAVNLGNYANFLRLIRKDQEKADEYYRRAIEADPNQAINRGNYALFLQQVRKDHNKAEEYYRRSIEIEPNHPFALGAYALFLEQIRKDHDKAEEYYRRSLEADPNRANCLGNYAGFLLSQGRLVDGIRLLDKVLDHPDLKDVDNSALAAGCWFYAFAHGPAEKRAEYLKNLKAVLLAGGRSPDGDLKPNVERARADSHPDIEWVEKLAAVITEGADISILNAWPAWRQA